MPRRLIRNAYVEEGPGYQVATEDGPDVTWDLHVIVETDLGRTFLHPRYFPRTRPDAAEALAARVRTAGSIDPELWVEIPERPSLEDRWDAYVMAENEMRMGLRAENDYAGCP